MPARNMNMKAGQVWTFTDSMYALLLVSANDAAVALAERVSGSLEAFEVEMDQAARTLGLADHPVLHDPSGLDDEFSVGGGNLISARDLAIVTRAAMAEPLIRQVVATPTYRFHGPDDVDHRLLNHDLLLTTYPGAIGVKTGYTRKAGHSVIAEATRDGRTMLAVVVDAVDPYRSATGLLDRGFATPLAAERGLDHLPAVPRNGLRPVPAARRVPTDAAARARAAPDKGRRRLPPSSSDLVLLLVGGLPAGVILLRRRAVRLRRERSRAGARRSPASRPGSASGGSPSHPAPRHPVRS
jgi:D-alanyl-D-alanine carboxypeptidase